MSSLRSLAHAFAQSHAQVQASESFDRVLDAARAESGLDVGVWPDGQAEHTRGVTVANVGWRDERAMETFMRAYRYSQAKAQTPPV